MKKISYFILILIMAMSSVLLAGCGGDSEANDNTSQEAAREENAYYFE